MIYGLFGLIAVLIVYIVLLHLKLKEVTELVQESSILMADENEAAQQAYYLKFNVDKDFKITWVNGDTLSYGHFKREELIGKSVLGTVMEDIPANREMLNESWKWLKKKKRIISSEQILRKSDGRKIPVLLRSRPILNELLQCKGISFWGYPLKQRVNLEKQLRKLQQKDKVVGDILNAESFNGLLEERVKIANRYNRPLLLIVVELADVYNFVNKGFSFDTGDKLLRFAADACIESTDNTACIGRFEQTKIGIIIENYEEEQIEKLVRTIWENIFAKICNLNVDKVNAGMFAVFYGRRKYNDRAENMLSRSRKHLKNSLLQHQYGIGSSDKFN